MFTHDIEDYELKYGSSTKFYNLPVWINMLTLWSHRLDKSCVFTRVLLNEESPCTITGRFCLRLSKAIWLKGIRVRLIGLLRV